MVAAHPAEWSSSGYSTERQPNGDLKISVTGGEDTALRMLVLQ